MLPNANRLLPLQREEWLKLIARLIELFTKIALRKLAAIVGIRVVHNIEECFFFVCSCGMSSLETILNTLYL